MIQTIMNEINEVMNLVDEKQIDATLPFFKKTTNFYYRCRT